MHHQTIIKLAESVKDIRGDFIELGVYKGASFKKILAVGMIQDRTCYAVDSFLGMAEPTEHDAGQYHKGKFNVGGPLDFLKLFSGRQHSFIEVLNGYIPDVLVSINPDRKFAFAHVDLDQYLPTKQALDWLYNRMSDGGIIACHDYLPGCNKDQLATKAIDGFMSHYGWTLSGLVDTVAWFKKHKSNDKQ